MSKNPQTPENNTQQKISRSAESTISRQHIDASKQSGSKIRLLAALIIVICAIVSATHWPALSAQAGFIDDLEYLNENVLVQNPGWTSAKRFLTEILKPSTVAGYYQPLAMLSLMTDYALGGRPDNLRPFHRTSLALHTANTALVIVLLYLLFGHVWPAAAAGLLFGLHPMTVEPICWVADRKTLLAAFFAFWSLVLYVRFSRKNNCKLYLACLLMYILALMSKPTSLPLPAVMLLLDYWPLKRLNRKAILEKLPFFAVAALFAVITYISQSRAAATVLPTQYGPQRIPLILCHNIIFYLYKIIWPANLSPHYAFPEPLSPANPLILAGIIGTAILLPLMLISLRWTPAILSGWLFFLIAILPTMGVIGFTNVIAADKFAYLPSLGLLMLLTSLLSWLRSTNTTAMLVARKTAIALAVLVLASAEAITTRRYLEHWQDTVRLCQHILTLTPNAARIHSQLALALKSQGKLDDAVAQYNEALRISPDYPNAHNDLGAVLARQGKLAQAIAHYNIALKLDPDLYQAHCNLADVLAQQGWLDEAVTHYTEALRINPELPSAHSSLATVLIQRGKFNEAIAHLTEALRIKPDSPDAHNNLGYILMHQGKLAQAITHFTEALRTRPDFANAHHNFGYALTRQGRLDEAVTHYTEALHIKPDFPEVHNDLAVILVRLGKLDDALNHYHQALQIRPDYPQPMTGIAHILINHPNPEKRDISNAIQLAEHAADLTRYQNPAILDTLAAAYAAQGRFDIAITTAQTALDLATAQKADELAAHIRTRLELYRQAKPHLQPQPSQNQIHP